MEKYSKILIKDIVGGSAADEAGIEKGDKLLSINSDSIKDILDYKFLVSDQLITLEVEKTSGEIWEIEIEKDFNEDPGIIFEKPLIDSPKVCRNKCIFCFMEQLASGMRTTLHFKDDDYRLSFLEGNYITLTNVSEEELERIIYYKLSPINISVHTTNGTLRNKMLNNPDADKINEYLKRLYDARIDINCQIVLCKGINDGKELEKTIMDLSMLFPAVRSISVVPVGLTRFRNGLYPLEVFDKESSGEVVRQIQFLQRMFKRDFGTNLVYLADEFYIDAEITIPSYSYYEKFYQLENGVGMVALFNHQFNNCLKRLKYNSKDIRKVSIVTGMSPRKYLKDMIATLVNRYKNLKVNLYPIRNDFFGHKITVTGLVTGRDIINQLENKELGEELLIPTVMLKDDTDLFLDDVTLEQVSIALGVKIRKIANDGKEFVKGILNVKS